MRSRTCTRRPGYSTTSCMPSGVRTARLTALASAKRIAGFSQLEPSSTQQWPVLNRGGRLLIAWTLRPWQTWSAARSAGEQNPSPVHGANRQLVQRVARGRRRVELVLRSGTASVACRQPAVVRISRASQGRRAARPTAGVMGQELHRHRFGVQLLSGACLRRTGQMRAREAGALRTARRVESVGRWSSREPVSRITLLAGA